MPTSTLYARLSAVLGHHSAKQELKWLRQKSSEPSVLTHMIERRLQGEPLQYILGTQPFGPLDLLVRRPVLIPRPETEDWTLRLSKLLNPSPAKPLKILDLCTGSGCIPLLLCHLWPSGSVDALAVDIADEAVDLAKDNAVHVDIYSRNKFSVIRADILSELFVTTLTRLGFGPFDVITANPPYIPQNEYDELPSSVKNYEDIRALLGDIGPQETEGELRGLTFYRRIAHMLGERNEQGCSDLVRPGGIIALEVGHTQSEEVKNLMVAHGRVRRTEIWNDPWGVERAIISWR